MEVPKKRSNLNKLTVLSNDLLNQQSVKPFIVDAEIFAIIKIFIFVIKFAKIIL